MADSFTGGENQSIRRTPPTYRESQQTLSHNVVSSTPPRTGFELTTLVVPGTDCTCSCKSNYHTITTTTTTAPSTQMNNYLSHRKINTKITFTDGNPCSGIGSAQACGVLDCLTSTHSSPIFINANRGFVRRSKNVMVLNGLIGYQPSYSL
jgi:hypothetical protein